VVPVDPETEAEWLHPPFSGDVADGFVWGRGTLDDKVGVVGILEAVEALIASGFEPRRTLYLAFGHDEEVSGLNGALKIVQHFRQRNLTLEFVLDEGTTHRTRHDTTRRTAHDTDQ
jgi:carboxypeptidase PM20D1